MLTLLIAAAVEDLPMKSRFLTADGKNYLLMNPDFVAEGAVDAKWSPDGTQLLVVCESPKRQPLEPLKTNRQAKVVFWSSTSRKAMGTFSVPTTATLGTAEWEGPNGSVIVSLDSGPDGTCSIHRVLVNGTTETLAPKAIGLSCSPTEKGALIMLDENGASALYYVAGGKSQPVKLATPAGTKPIQLFRGGFMIDMIRNNVPTTLVYDSKSNSFKQASSLEPTQVRPRTGEGMSRLGSAKLQANFQSLWVTGDEDSKYPAALLAATAQKGGLSERASAAWFIDSGNAFVRQLKPVTPEELDDALECEEMQRLLAEAKQVGTAIRFYLSDNENRFPPLDKFREALMPYTRNEALLTGFSASFKAGLRLEDIADVTKEVIGYKNGAYGRAATYADTHTVWESRRRRPQIGCEE